MAEYSPDSPTFAVNSSKSNSPRHASQQCVLETEPMTFPGTSLKTFGFVGTTKFLIMNALSETLRDPGDKPGPLQFPGPQPVSIDSQTHFETIRSQPYLVATKTDGVRACMFIYSISPGVNVITLFDRKMDQPYGVFIERVPKSLFQGFGTVLDGELVMNRFTGKYVFLAFDTVILASFPQFHKPAPDRIGAIEHVLRMSYAPTERDTVVLEIKRFTPLHTAPYIGAHLNDPRFENDGFVFMPLELSVKFGHHDQFFKLKTVHSVDFLYKAGSLMIFNSDTRRYIKAGVLNAPSDIPDGAIVECLLVSNHETPSKRVWRILTPRPDKNKSNTLYVLNKTLLNIRENLTYGSIRSLV